jgi:hypothetical protein
VVSVVLYSFRIVFSNHFFSSLLQVVIALAQSSLKNFRRCRVIGAPQQQVQSFQRAAKDTAVSMPTPWPSNGVAHSAQQPTLPSAPPLIYPTPRPTRNAWRVIPVPFVWSALMSTFMLVVNAYHAVDVI